MYRQYPSSIITKVFGFYIGKTGLIRQEALNYGFDPIEEEIESITRASYYPGSKSIWIKIIVDRKSRRILGRGPFPIEHSLAIQMDIHSDLHYHWLPIQV